MSRLVITLLPITGLLLPTVTGAASRKPASPPVSRSAQVCNTDEDTDLLCYTAKSGGTPQNVSVSDIRAVAAYLRSYGQETSSGRFWTMTAADAPDCAEWTIFSEGSVLALARHVNSSVDSSVLYEDIATTVDGRPGNATAIVNCLANGGSMGVLVNSSNQAYNSIQYIESGAEPDGILIKIVSSGAS